MEGLQIAQIIADLQALQNADPNAASSLLSASKNLSTATATRQKSSLRAGLLPEPPRFDKLGRRILTGPPTPNGGSGSSSGTGTPLRVPPQALETDEDMKRAKTLLELVEMRGKFKQMGDTGLSRAQQRVDAVVTKYAKADLEEKEHAARLRQRGPVLR